MHPGKAIVPAQRSKVGPAGSTRMRAFVSEKLMRALQIRKAFHDLSEADRGKAEVRKKIELKLIHCAYVCLHSISTPSKKLGACKKLIVQCHNHCSAASLLGPGSDCEQHKWTYTH